MSKASLGFQKNTNESLIASGGKSDVKRSQSINSEKVVQDNKPDSAKIFKIGSEQLQELFIEEKEDVSGNMQTNEKARHDLYKTLGFGEGIMKMLATEINSGIIGDEKDLTRRIKFYGENTKPLPQLPGILDSIKEALDNRILVALGIAAFFSMIAGAINEPGYMGWLQGFSIYIGIFLIVSFSAVNDYLKDKNFVKLASDVKKDKIGVIRGKHGVTQTISIYKVVVGDVLLLEPGCSIPADCVLVDGQDVYVDESKYSDDRFNKRVYVVNQNNASKHYNPFLLSGSFIVSGSGKALVCAVGANSRRGAYDDKLDTESKTPLQKKLDNLGAICTKYGILASLAIFGASITNFIFNVIFSESFDFTTMVNLLTLYATQFVTVIIVAVPEGLPLTISLSLAYSVMRMKKDGVLIKDLNSPEVMGRVDQILIGKTGTLTVGDFKVTDFYVQGKHLKNKRANTLFNTELKDEVLRLIQDSIVYNCDARIEMNNKAFYEPVGNNTEVALLKFLQDAEVPIHETIREKVGFIEYQIPFSSVRKSSAIAIKYPDHDIVRIYVKGAPEQLVFNCSSTYDINGDIITLDEEEQQTIVDRYVRQEFAMKGLRVLGFGYKDLSIEEFNNLRQENNQFALDKDREAVFFRGLRLISIFAMKDQLRPEVIKAIKLARGGNISVRLISGDHPATTAEYAVQAKIIKPEEITSACITGEQFRERVGGIRQDKDGMYYLEKPAEFRAFIKEDKIKVIARARPEDKMILSVGLKELKHTVALTGEGINDIKGLKTSDVGFAMGSGVSAAKNAAQMILVEDNVMSIVNAVLWGRNIYSNVRKFIQFQLTVNFTALILLFFVALITGQAAFSVVQLLWINMIMDMLAALALAAERPQLSVIKNPPVKDSEPIITKPMWRQILGMTLYITIVMVFMFFFLDEMWGIDFPDFNSPWYNADADGTPTGKTIYFTMLFNIFIYLHLFNEINSRKVKSDQLNVFEHLLDNFLFIGIFCLTIAVQYLMTQYGGRMVRCAALEPDQHAFCVLIGSSSLIAGFMLKFLPERINERIPALIDETKSNEKDKLVQFYNKQAEAKVVDKKAAEKKGKLGQVKPSK